MKRVGIHNELNTSYSDTNLQIWPSSFRSIWYVLVLHWQKQGEQYLQSCSSGIQTPSHSFLRGWKLSSSTGRHLHRANWRKKKNKQKIFSIHKIACHSLTIRLFSNFLFLVILEDQRWQNKNLTIKVKTKFYSPKGKIMSLLKANTICSRMKRVYLLVLTKLVLTFHLVHNAESHSWATGFHPQLHQDIEWPQKNVRSRPWRGGWWIQSSWRE